MGNYRVAIVGCGPRGSAISLAYAAHPRTTVVAVCDLRRELRDRLGDVPMLYLPEVFARSAGLRFTRQVAEALGEEIL